MPFFSGRVAIIRYDVFMPFLSLIATSDGYKGFVKGGYSESGEMFQGDMSALVLPAGNSHSREEGGDQVKKITIRKAGAVKLTGSVRALYGGCGIA